MCGKAEGRVLLPPDVEPITYKIKLAPDLERYVFNGEESIEVEVVTATDSVSMHSREIYIQEATFVCGDGEKIEATAIGFDLKLTIVKFSFAKPLPVGAGTFNITFQGCLNAQMAGFYRSSYTAINGEKRVMASTQFEPLDARRAFPCWDEPARKAVFEVTLVVPNDRTAFSNMPEAESHELPGGKREIKFLPSPKMSTYLLAFCVGEFDFVQGLTQHGVLCRVYTPPGKSSQGAFALQVAIDTLDLYDDFFKVPYPLPKLDMVAIPEFAMGAMENWGLVTYREVDMLIDEKKASSQQRQRVCLVITHELAHQWFGNLVTMAWWDDLWLNEGFASWTMNWAADKLFPDWRLWDQFVSGPAHSARSLDSLRSSHPIQVPIAHAEEVMQVFDAISYHKGACVVKMIYAILGPEQFQKGLQVYMDRHKYGNTETYHLWTAWEEVSRKPIKSLMASWTEHVGYPVVSVAKEKWTPTAVTLTLRQRWFLADGSEVAEAEKKLWKVPLQVAAGGGGDGGGVGAAKLELMDGETHTLTVPLAAEGYWVSLNLGQHTLLRVQYTPEMLRRLEGGVRSKNLPAEDRAGLIQDTYALAKAGMLPVAEVLRLLPAYLHEDNSTVWAMLEIVLGGLSEVMVEDEAMYGRFSGVVAKLLAPLTAAVGWEPRPDDGHLSKMLRGTMVRLLKSFGWRDPAVVVEARQRFDAYYADPEDVSTLPSECITPVFQIVARTGGEAEYAKLMELYRRAGSAAEQKNVFAALGYAEAPHLKLRTLEWTVDDVKLQDFMYPMVGVVESGKAGMDVAWHFFQDNLERIRARLATAVSSLLDKVIVTCCGGFCNAARVAEVEAFFETHPLPHNQRKIAQMLESMKIQSRFLASMAESPLTTEAFWTDLSSRCL